MHFKIIKIGKTKKEYHEIVTKFLTFLLPNNIEIIEIKESNSKDVHKKIKEENLAISKYLDQKIQTIILTEHGKNLSSTDFAKKITELSTVTGKLQIIIGGAFGFEKEFLTKFQHQIALSKLTFPHDLAFVILLEQLYRAITITNNKSYHY